MYKWQQVKALKSQGVSIKKIARKLKLSKNGSLKRRIYRTKPIKALSIIIL